MEQAFLHEETTAYKPIGLNELTLSSAVLGKVARTKRAHAATFSGDRLGREMPGKCQRDDLITKKQTTTNMITVDS